jgi:hypothetical protein
MVASLVAKDWRIQARSEAVLGQPSSEADRDSNGYRGMPE